MNVYIAGPIKGNKNYKTDFVIAEGKLWGDGHQVLNPTKLPEGMNDKLYMPICISMVEQADWVYLLPGWEESLGCIAEATYAARQGKALFSVDRDGYVHLVVWDPQTHWFKGGI